MPELLSSWNLAQENCPMSHGKYLSLREAIKGSFLERFAKEHKTTGDRNQFNRVLNAMTKTPSATGQASDRKSNDED